MSEFKDTKQAKADDSDSEDEDGKGPALAEETAAAAAPEEDTSLNNPDVVTKYQEAAKITQSVLTSIVAMCVPGARIVDICKAGDDMIEQKTSLIFNKKNKQGKHVLKGVAFPVCISVNECVCHCSPLLSEGDSLPPLAADDMVKIDMGVHVDGYIVLVAHTCIVGMDISTPEAALSIANGPRSNVINAAYTAAEVASRLIKNGNTNAMVTQAMKSVAELFGCDTIGGTVMHQMKQFVIDGSKMVLLKDDPEQKMDACTFETGEVYAIDIAMTSGDGKPRESGARTTVLKRAVDQKYGLKNKASRAFFNEVNKKFPTLPFSLRAFEDEQAVKLGVRECVNHKLLQPYHVLEEKKGEVVAHVKFTVLLMPNGTLQVSGLPPVTFDAMCAAGLASGEDVPLMGGNIGAILAKKVAVERGIEVDEAIMTVLNEVKPVNKKKAKKAAAAKKKAQEEASAGEKA